MLALAPSVRRTSPNANRSGAVSGSLTSTIRPRTAAAESGIAFRNAPTLSVICCSESLPAREPAPTTRCSQTSDPSGLPLTACVCSSITLVALPPPPKSKDNGGSTITLPGDSHCSAAFNPAARFWSVGTEIAARGRPASAIRGRNRKPENNRIELIRLRPANREKNPGRNCIGEQSANFMKLSPTTWDQKTLIDDHRKESVVRLGTKSCRLQLRERAAFAVYTKRFQMGLYSNAYPILPGLMKRSLIRITSLALPVGALFLHQNYRGDQQ